MGPYTIQKKMKNAALSLMLLSPMVFVAHSDSDTCGTIFEGDFNEWLNSAFNSMDLNKDNKIDKDENNEISGIMDSNDDGDIQLNEFLDIDGKTLFNILDKNKDEYWSNEEVPENLIHMIENNDGFEENNDNKIDLVEFLHYYSSLNRNNGQNWSSTEILLLSVAGMIAIIAIILLYNHWKSNILENDNNSSQAFLGVEEYELEYPPEVLEFQELRDSGEEDKIKLQRALMKRAVATVPMRIYIQNEEKNVQRLYQKSMISPTTWSNFQACREEVKMELEVIKEEAELLKQGWGETIIPEAHFLQKSVEDEKKMFENMQLQKKEQANAILKAQQNAQNEKMNKTKNEEQEKLQREKAILELEQEAAREAEAAKKKKNKKK